MKQITITLTDDDYALFNKYANTFKSKSDEYIAKYIILKRLDEYQANIESSVRTRTITRFNNRKQKEKEAAKAYMKRKRKLKKQNTL